MKNCEKFPCKSNEYFDPKSSYCRECHPNCSKCSSRHSCTQCISFYKLVDEACVPIDSCNMPSLNKIGTHRNCMQCSDNCLYCDPDDTKCLFCDIGFFNQEGECVLCPKDCYFCYDKDFCEICKKGFEESGGICQKNIFGISEQGKQKNTFSSDSKELEMGLGSLDLSLDPTCVFRQSSNLKKCILCKSGFFLDFDFICQACSINCQKCYSKKICIKCSPLYELQKMSNTNEVICLKKKVKKTSKLIKEF